MAFVVGEVITKFEAEIKSFFKALDSIEQKLDELAKKKYEFAVELDEKRLGTTKVINAIEKVEEAVDRISNKIKKIVDGFGLVIGKLTQNIGNLADTTSARLGDVSESVVKKLLYRTVGIAAAIKGIELFVAPITGFVNVVGNQAIMSFERISVLAASMKTAFWASAQSTKMIATNFLPLLGNILAFAVPLTLFPFFLRESYVFVMSIFRGARTNLGLIEHISRLVKTLDNSLAYIYGTTRRIFTIVGGLGAGYFIALFLPIFRLPMVFTTINTVFGAITRSVRVFWIRLRSGMGDARATFQLTIFTAITSVSKLLPHFIKIASSFAAMRTESVSADKEIRKLGKSKNLLSDAKIGGVPLGESLKPLKALSRMKLPFTKQFQIFATELKLLLEVAIKQITQIILVIQKAFGISSKEMTGFRDKSDSTFKLVDEKINNISAVMERKPMSALKKVFGFLTKKREITPLLGSVEPGIIGKTIAKISEPLKRAFSGKEVKVFSTKTREADKAIKRVAERVKQVNLKKAFRVEALDKFIEKIKQTGKESKNIDVLRQSFFRLQRSLGEQTRGGFTPMRKLFQTTEVFLNLLSKGSGTIDGSRIAIFKMARAHYGLQLATGKGKEAGELFFDLFGKYKGASPKEAAKILEKMREQVQKLLATFSKAKSPGDAFLKSLTSGLKSGGAEGEKMLARLISVFQAIDPKFLEAGKKISQQVGTGMKASKGKLGKDAEEAVTEISKRLPASLAKLGPLRNLIKAGALIPFQIAQGIRKGKGYIAKAISIVLRGVTDPLALLGDFNFRELTQATRDLKLFAQRTGMAVEQLSALDSVLKPFNTSVTELGYTIQTIQTQMSEATKNEEARQGFERLGIDIEKINDAATPTLETIYQFSDAISKTEAGTGQFIKTLRKMGVMLQSNVVNVLMLGSDEIKRLMGLAIQWGAFVDTEFATLSTNFEKILVKFKIIKDVIKKDFLAKILPEINKSLNEVFDLITDNIKEIRIVTIIVGQVISLAIKSVREFIKFVINEPKKAMNSLLATIQAFGNLLIDLFSNIIGIIFHNLKIWTAQGFFDFWPDLEKNVIKTFEILAEASWEGLKTFLNWINKKVLYIILLVNSAVVTAVLEIVPAFFVKLGKLMWFHLKTAIFVLLNKLASWGNKCKTLSRIPIIGDIIKGIDIIAREMGEKLKKSKPEGFLKGMTKTAKNAMLSAHAFSKKASDAWGDLFHTTTDKSKKLQDELGLLDSFLKKMKEKALDTKAMDKFKASFAKFLNDMTKAWKNTPLQNLPKELKQILSSENWDKIVEKMNKVAEKARKLTGTIKTSMEGMSDIWRDDSSGLTEAIRQGFGRTTIVSEEDIPPPPEPEKYKGPIYQQFAPVFEGIEQTLHKALTQGKVTITDLSKIAEQQFSSSFSTIFQDFQQGAIKSLSKLLSGVTGIASSQMGAAISGIVAAGMLLLSRLKSTSETTNEAVQSSIQQTEQLRGVIAGETQIGILEISNRLSLINRPMVSELRGIKSLVQDIRDFLLGSGDGLSFMAEF